MTSQDAVEDAQRMKRDLLDRLEQLAEDLPPNTLDELIDELGGPDNVAEVGLVCSVSATLYLIKAMPFLNVCNLCNADDWPQRQGSQQR